MKRNCFSPFLKAFDQNDSEVTDKMNLRPLEHYEIRLVNELSGNSVVVERVGFRASNYPKRRHPSSDIWDTLESGPVVRDFERRVLSRPKNIDWASELLVAFCILCITVFCSC